MRRRQIDTKFWIDEKVRAASWLEKQVMLHLLTRSEMLTIGAITTTVSSITTLMNGIGRNWVTPEFPRIGEDHIGRAIRAIRKRGIIEVMNSADTTVFFLNFLSYQDWSSTVVRSWPRMIDEQVPQGFIQGVIRETCVEYCVSKKKLLPDEWA